MKRISLLRLVCAIVLAAIIAIPFAAGCAAPAPTSEKPTYHFKAACEAGYKGDPNGDYIDMWAELVEEATDGRISFDVFYQGDLGTPEEMFDLLLKGGYHMSLTWPMTSYDPRVAILNVPYLVFDWDQLREAYSPGGWLNQVVDPVFNGLGLKFFGAIPEGFGGVATKGKYATNPEQAKELKVRSQPIFPYPQCMDAMGYQVAVISWGEVYTSIETGVVDGDSGNVIFWDESYFGDLLDYYVNTKHIVNAGAALMNLEAFNSLNAEDQKLVTDAATQMLAKQFAMAEELDLKYRQEAIDKGIEFIELTPEDMALNVKLVRETVWPMMDEKIGTILMDQIRATAPEPPQ